MLKTLIASTFLAASIAVPVMAADSGTSGTNMKNSGAAGTTNNGAGTTNNGTTPMTTTPGAATGAAAGTNAAAGMSMYGQNVTASNIIGASVMDASNNSIGKIDDLVLSGEGQVTDYVVDVGGFLGIGSKRVALTPQDVTITADGNGNLQAKTQLTKDALNARPDYTKPEVPTTNNNGAAGTTNTTAPAGSTGTSGGTTAPAAKP